MSFSNIPTTEHWAVITTSSYYVPGDERSRTNPGHGYPEHTVETIQYQAFTDRKKLDEEIQRLVKRNSKFKVMLVNPCVVETSVQIKLTTGS